MIWQFLQSLLVMPGCRLEVSKKIQLKLRSINHNDNNVQIQLTNIRITTLSISLLLSRLAVLLSPDLFLWSGLGFNFIWSGLGSRQRSDWCYRGGEEGFQPGRLQEYERHVRNTDIGYYTIKWKNNQIIPDQIIKQLNVDIILYWWLNHQSMNGSEGCNCKNIKDLMNSTILRPY